MSVLVGSRVLSQHHTKAEVTLSLKKCSRISIYAVSFGSVPKQNKWWVGHHFFENHMLSA